MLNHKGTGLKKTKKTKKTAASRCDGCGKLGHVPSLTHYGEPFYTSTGRHPARLHSGAVEEINHGIHVLNQLSARRLFDYATGVSSKLTSSLLKLEHAQQLFGQHGSAAQDLAISKDCSRLLCEFTDAIDSAINELSAVEYLALVQNGRLQLGMAKDTTSKAPRKTRNRKARN